ncbi:MAG: T9SS type A sorting domain-containing protein [Ginsengibacter sp.]
MKKFYLLIQLFFFFSSFYSNSASAQLTATITAYESRCAATGAIKIVATDTSGSFQYKVQGPVNTNFTDQDSITGLSSGIYTVIVNNINTGETITQGGIVIFGSYADPGFTLGHVNVSCDNGYNGSISIQGFIINGRGPFIFTIVAPSPMGVGTTSPDGSFGGLKAGDYSIQMNDSCGGIQTRTVTINNYTWSLDTYGFTKTSCDLGAGFVSVKDSKGNDSKYTTIPGFSYGLVRSAGDTIWTSDGNFTNITITGLPSVNLLAKDGCGNIKEVTTPISLVPFVDAAVKISNQQCTTFSAAVTGVTNFFPADYALFNGAGMQIASNATGQFDNLAYGDYCIKVHDGCTDTTIERCFSKAGPIASVAANVTISNKLCTTFSVSIDGQQNLTNPGYCLLNSVGVVIDCNSTGHFDNQPYGEYCITIKDGCIDTTITRCFSASRPVPKVNDPIVPAYVTCTNFGLDVGAQSDSLTNPVFCLYDKDNNPIGTCNSTGIFDSIPLGSYYVTIHDGCTDTTIKRDFTVNMPVIINDVNVAISDENCTTFTATASSNNLTNAEFCLFNSVDSSLISCGTNGVFTGLIYGKDYYISSKNGCPDTTMLTSFSDVRSLPSVNSAVQISNKTCTTFSANITNWQNLISPEFCLIDTTSKDTLDCNTSGIFNNVPFGSYLIQIVSGCNDTLRVLFSQAPDSIVLTVTASKSCTYGYSLFTIKVKGVLPTNIKIYAPDKSLVKEVDSNSSNFTIDNLLPLASGDTYMVIGTDACGNKDTVNIAPIVGYLIPASVVVSKCPGSVWPNGSGNINTTISTNLSGITVRIIKKDGTAVSFTPDYVSGSNYAFNDLGPATYIIRYQSSGGCGVSFYDTVTITNYKYPGLAKSSAYQCDVNGFSVGAVASNGVGPFTYEIIGSTPSLPTLIAPPQPDPVFTINNGTTYSLIRLRALDACGNATLGDVSILPLANNGIKSTLNCLDQPTTLSVDTIYNSTYSWVLLKKNGSGGFDSLPVSGGFNYYLPNILPSDTGVYVCHVEVNNGCINRDYLYHLDGKCFSVLPLSLENFAGKLLEGSVLLTWNINNSDNLQQIIVERKNDSNNFVDIATVNTIKKQGESRYQFLDKNAESRNFYRIKMVKDDYSISYSYVISVGKQLNSGVVIYPNPATDLLNIEFYQPNRHIYKISLVNMLNQKLKEVIFNTGNSSKLQMKRPKGASNGIYILLFTDVNTHEEFSQKIILR